MTRWKAAAIHFAISLVALGPIAAFVVWRWYPPELIGMAKAGQLLSILGGVDLVLGPLLTLVVYKHGKQSLRFDLSVIALLQIAALAFGLSVVWQSRPVYLVATSDRFRLVFANEIDANSLRRAPPRYRTLPAWGPVAVAAPIPRDSKRNFEVMLQTLAGRDISQCPEYYVPYPPADPALLAHAATAEQVARAAPSGDRAAWRDVFESAGIHNHGVSILPLSSSRGSATVLLAPGTGALLGFSGRDPWPVFDALEKQKAGQTR